MKKQIAVVMEGDKTEKGYWKAVEKAYFRDYEIQFVQLPFGKNLYMLWKRMQEDNFETDIIEVIKERFKEIEKQLEDYTRDDFQEVYLFFDYDPHQHNLNWDGLAPDEVLGQMLEAFDNETENGKLYISYPMSEALRDIREMSCKSHSHCLVSTDDFKLISYKEMSGEKNEFNYYKSYTERTWDMIIAIFLKRCACLFSCEEPDADLLRWFKSSVGPMELFRRENELLYGIGKVFVLSAFPEFLLDYFRPSRFDNAMSLVSSIRAEACTEKWKLR